MTIRGETGFDLGGGPVPARELLGDLWRARELIGILSRKEFLVRYRRTSFGLIWAVALPLLQAIVLAVVLEKFVRFDTAGNYVVFAFAGTVVWTFFANALTGGVGSVTDNSGLSSKIYFPRAVFPIVSTLSGLYGLGITLIVLAGLSAATGDGIGVRLFLLVPATALLVVLATSLAAVAAALQVYFRDVRWIVTAILMPLFYLTPVIYPLDAPEVDSVRRVVQLNPVTGVVEAFRAATTGAEAGAASTVWVTLGWTVLAVSAAVALYRRHDRVLVDLL